jgi:outer membrane protein OmpA-like peptidoglycan-associated protein
VGEGIDLSTTRRLSLVRARAVKAALVAGGLAETRIDIRPMGHSADRIAMRSTCWRSTPGPEAPP